MRFWEATGEQSPAETFIEQIYSEYPVSPLNPDQHAVLTGEGENQTIALFELEPSKSVRGAVELHWIQAYPQRQGVGTAAIRELQAKARAAGIKMSLYPKPNGSVSQASLKRLYKRLGFNPIHKGAATMVWDPAVNEQQLNELADQPYKFQYAQHGAMKTVYGFETDAGAEYVIHIHPMKHGGAFQNNALDVSFALLDEGEATDRQTGTAGSEALRVFGTVVTAVRDSLAYRTEMGLNIEYIRFAAKRDEPKRIALYQRFARNIGRYLPGWELVKLDTTDAVFAGFLLKRNSKSIKEDAGNQVIVYHGNQGGIHREFVAPMWWTESYEDAVYYATLNDMDGYVYKATLSCNNPYVISKQDANTVLQKWRELAIKGYDCIHDSDTGDWIPFHSKDINLIGYDSLDPELDEDWRHVVTGLGAASMLAGGGSAAYDAYKAKQQPAQQPQVAHVQQVQASQPKIQAPQAKPEVSQAQAVSHAQDLLATKGAQILQRAAKAAGLKGTELAQFMAQCAHETANFTTLKELGDKNYFKKYDIKFAPEKAKQLGNLRPGDGDLYKGRGFIQLTGRYNYKKAGEALGLPLEKNPQLVERPDVAAKVALWFWKNRVQPQVDNFSNTQDATKPINPGLKGLTDRHNKFVGMKVATAKPQPKAATPAAKPVKVAQKPAPVKGKKV